MPCHLSDLRYPEDAILKKKHNLQVALRYLMWPSLMLFGGALLIGLVILTQYLAQMCNEVVQEEDGQNKLYRFLPWRPWSSSIDGED